MQRHLSTIRVISLLRILVELALGAWITLVALGWNGESGEGFLNYHPTARPETGDREAFYILGAGFILLGLIRLLQVVGAFAVHPWARVLGQWLGWIDLLTPVTLPLGLWALQVYRHPDTRQVFKRPRPVSADQAAL